MEMIIFIGESENKEQVKNYRYGIELSIYNHHYYNPNNLRRRIVKRLGYHWDSVVESVEITYRGEHRHLHANVIISAREQELNDVDAIVNFRLGKKSGKCWYSCRVARVYRIED